MKKVQTLTINGVTYEISDPNAATKSDIGDISTALDELHAYAQGFHGLEWVNQEGIV